MDGNSLFCGRVLLRRLRGWLRPGKNHFSDDQADRECGQGIYTHLINVYFFPRLLAAPFSPDI
jgi:hypothetical protein